MLNNKVPSQQMQVLNKFKSEKSKCKSHPLNDEGQEIASGVKVFAMTIIY
jgi:hypothetical protein